MEARLGYLKLAPEPARALYAVEKYLTGCGLGPGLLHLLKTRASQLNGCGYCIDMHTQDARAGGETEQRLYALSAWREGPFFTPRERAALGWAEAVTRLEGGGPDAAFDEVRRHFTDKEVVDLTWAVAAINGWNRLAVGLRAVPGAYRPHLRAQLEARLG